MAKPRRASFPNIVKAAITATDTSNPAVTDEFDLGGGAPLHVEIYLSAGPTGAGTVTFELKHGTVKAASGRLFNDGKTVAVSAATDITKPIRLSLQPEVAGDQTYTPPGMFGRLHADSSGADGTATIAAIVVVQPEN